MKGGAKMGAILLCLIGAAVISSLTSKVADDRIAAAGGVDELKEQKRIAFWMGMFS